MFAEATWVGNKLTAECPASSRGAVTRLLRCEGAESRDWAEGLLAAHQLYDLIVVPGVFGFLWRFDLHYVHVVDHQSIGANVATLGKHIVDLRPLELRHHLVGIGRPNGLDGFEVVHGGGVVSGLNHASFFIHLLEKALTEGAAFIGQFPVPGGRQVQPLRSLKAEAVYVIDRSEESRV